MSLAMIRPVEFAQSLCAWGVTLPADAEDALALWEATSAAASAVAVDDMATKAARGEITVKNVAKVLQETAVAMAATAKMQEAALSLAPVCAQRFSAAIGHEADSIVTALREKFDRQVAIIVAGAELVAPGTSADDVLGLGGDAMQAWQNLALAAAQLDSIAVIRGKLAREYGYGDVVGVECYISATPPLTARGLSQARYIAKGALDSRAALPEARGGIWQHLLAHGYTLHLNDAAEAASVAHPQPDPIAA